MRQQVLGGRGGAHVGVAGPLAPGPRIRLRHLPGPGACEVLLQAKVRTRQCVMPRGYTRGRECPQNTCF